MSEWKLKDCCLSISDGDHLPPPKTDVGIPFITISNIDSTNHIDFADTLFVPQEYYDNLDPIRKPIVNDIIYSVVGSFGKPVLIKKNKKFVFQRHIAILRPNRDIVDSSYLYYVMLSQKFYLQADTLAIGAAQRTISLTSLRNMKINIPPMAIQLGIATILSRYDSLMENYQEQIRLLEEASQRLYKEWFINFNFPGHEKAKIVDGMPEGWEKKRITDLLEIKYGKDHKTLSNGSVPVYGTGGIMRYVDKSLYSGESVLIPRKGSLNNIMLVNCTFWTIDTMFYTIPKIENAAKIAYFNLRKRDMYSMNIGAAVPSMTINILNGMELLLPDATIRKQFEKITGNYYRLISYLHSQIRTLTEARDRLLPKLMSGEISVETAQSVTSGLGVRKEQTDSPQATDS